MEKVKKFLFGEHSLRQTLAKNSFWSTVSNVGSQLTKLLVIIYAARLLGAEQYGLFSYALSVAGIFTIFSDFGLNQIFFINAARRDENPPAYFSTLILIRLFLIFAVATVTVLIGPLITKFGEAQALILLVALLLASDDFRAFLNGIARLDNRIDKEAFGNIITNILIVVFVFLAFAFFPPTSYYLTLAYLAGSALGTLLVFWIVRKDFKKIFLPLKFNRSLVRTILTVSVPFGLANIMWMVMTSTDALVIGWLRTASELGYYAAAQRPVMALSIIPTIIAASSLALVARLAKEGAGERLRILTERLITLSLVVVLPFVVGGIILAPAIIDFLYGAEYLPAIFAFQLLCVTLLISYPASIVSNLILSFKEHKAFTMAMVSGALGNLFLDILLVPLWGIAGSVVATIGALLIINIYIGIKAKKLQPFEILRFLPRIFAATLFMGGITFFLSLLVAPLFINILLSGLVYLGVLVLLREPLLGELKSLFHF